jgi:hypothetical protein
MNDVVVVAVGPPLADFVLTTGIFLLSPTEESTTTLF